MQEYNLSSKFWFCVWNIFLPTRSASSALPRSHPFPSQTSERLLCPRTLTWSLTKTYKVSGSFECTLQMHNLYTYPSYTNHTRIHVQDYTIYNVLLILIKQRSSHFLLSSSRQMQQRHVLERVLPRKTLPGFPRKRSKTRPNPWPFTTYQAITNVLSKKSFLKLCSEQTRQTLDLFFKSRNLTVSQYCKMWFRLVHFCIQFYWLAVFNLSCTHFTSQDLAKTSRIAARLQSRRSRKKQKQFAEHAAAMQWLDRSLALFSCFRYRLQRATCDLDPPTKTLQPTSVKLKSILDITSAVRYVLD